MKKNVGTVDKVIRVLIAIAFLLLYILNVVSGTFGIVLLVLAGSLVLTSFISFCPLYLVLRINTGKSK